MLDRIVDELLRGAQAGIAQRAPAAGLVVDVDGHARGAAAHQLAGTQADHHREGERARGEEDQQAQHGLRAESKY